MKLPDYRRVVHVAILVVIVLVVRACGGAIQAEDRLNSASRWAADKTGLAGAKAVLDTKVKPRVGGVTSSMSYAVYDAVSRTMDSTEMALDGFAAWVGQQVSNTETAIEERIRAALTPSRVNDVPQRPGGSRSDESSTNTPSQ
jgi:hypothetical protein